MHTPVSYQQVPTILYRKNVVSNSVSDLAEERTRILLWQLVGQVLVVGKLEVDHHFRVLTEFQTHARVILEIHAMMRKRHTDCLATPATFTWQGAGEGTFM